MLSLIPWSGQMLIRFLRLFWSTSELNCTWTLWQRKLRTSLTAVAVRVTEREQHRLRLMVGLYCMNFPWWMQLHFGVIAPQFGLLLVHNAVLPPPLHPPLWYLHFLTLSVKHKVIKNDPMKRSYEGGRLRCRIAHKISWRMSKFNKRSHLQSQEGRS